MNVLLSIAIGLFWASMLVAVVGIVVMFWPVLVLAFQDPGFVGFVFAFSTTWAVFGYLAYRWLND